MNALPVIPWLGGKRRLAEFMKTCKGKVMVSLNDHPDIRRAFDGLTIIGGELLGIKYSVANAYGDPETSKEVVILNYDPLNVGGLFYDQYQIDRKLR